MATTSESSVDRLGEVNTPEDALVLLGKLMWLSLGKELGEGNTGWHEVSRCLAMAWCGFRYTASSPSDTKSVSQVKSGSGGIPLSVGFEEPRSGSQSLGGLIFDGLSS